MLTSDMIGAVHDKLVDLLRESGVVLATNAEWKGEDECNGVNGRLLFNDEFVGHFCVVREKEVVRSIELLLDWVGKVELDGVTIGVKRVVFSFETGGFVRRYLVSDRSLVLGEKLARCEWVPDGYGLVEWGDGGCFDEIWGGVGGDSWGVGQ